MSLQDGINQEELEPPALPDLPLKLSKFVPETKELYATFQCSICYEVCTYLILHIINQCLYDIHMVENL